MGVDWGSRKSGWAAHGSQSGLRQSAVTCAGRLHQEADSRETVRKGAHPPMFDRVPSRPSGGTSELSPYGSKPSIRPGRDSGTIRGRGLRPVPAAADIIDYQPEPG